mgnify:CR=1 FL=1
MAKAKSNAKSKLKKIAEILPLVCAAACAFLLVFAAVSGKKKNEPAYLFGYAVLRVETGSMEPAIPSKSFILVKKYKGGELAEGEIAAYRMRDTSSAAYGSLVTHRVEKITESGVIFKGDANPAADNLKVQSEDIVAVYVKNLPALTFFGRLYASPLGLAALIGMFVCVCAFVYVPEMVSALNEGKEEEKQKLIDERVREEVRKLKEADERRAQTQSGREQTQSELTDKTPAEERQTEDTQAYEKQVKDERVSEKK